MSRFYSSNSTPTNLNKGIEPVPDIGPTFVVPILHYQLQKFHYQPLSKSVRFKSEIEFNLNIFCPTPIDPPFPESVNVKFDLAIGL